MPVYQFPEIVLKGCGTVSADTFRITIASQNLATYALSWTSPTVCSEQPFTGIPGYNEQMEREAGSIGIDLGQFQCRNIEFTGTVRMSTLFDYNPFDTRWHIRLEKKNGASWDIEYQGMIAADAEIEQVDPNNEDTWRVTFDTEDSIMQFDEVTVASAITHIPHATYDYTPTFVYICYNDGGSPQRAKLYRWAQVDKAGDDINDWRLASELRFMRLRDICEGIADSIGLSLAINNGSDVDSDWVYYIYDGSTAVAKDFDDLYIVSAAYHSSVYQHYWTIFDVNKWSELSFYNEGSALEMLKAILTPHGLTCKMAFTTGGDRYLEIGQVQTNSGVSFASYRTPIRFKPASRVLYGISVNVANAGEYIINSSGDGATAIGCKFISANRMPDPGNGWAEESAFPGLYSTRDLAALFGSLWALDGTDMHSVYKVDVKSHGQTGASGTGITADYDDADAGLVFGKAAAAYWFNPVIATSDEVGIYRRIMRRMEISVGGIQTDPSPREYLSYSSQKWWILEKKWDLQANKTTFICECGEW